MIWLRVALFAVLLPGLALGLGPWWMLRSGWGGRVDLGALHLLGWLPLASGVALMLWCWYDFATRGHGTPAPYDPPTELVVSGPYRVVRNPMYVAGVFFLLGLAFVTGAPGLVVYAAGFWLATALFVKGYEEPALRRQFGETYERYRRTVPAWLPRVLALLLAVALAGASTGCASGARRSYVVSSERSDYSPVVRLAIAVDTTADSIGIRIDGGTVLAPGDPSTRDVPIMRGLSIEGLLVTAPTGATADTTGAPPPWTELAASAPALLADSLLLGVPREVGAMRLAVARPRALDPRRSWIVFRIRGAAVTTPVHMADGTVVPSRVIEDGVRVYACAERSLAGTLDRERARRLSEATTYGGAC
jgi:protein-S-isoprenylcysteine O-methyltransferase Ste14